ACPNRADRALVWRVTPRRRHPCICKRGREGKDNRSWAERSVPAADGFRSSSGDSSPMLSRVIAAQVTYDRTVARRASANGLRSGQQLSGLPTAVAGVVG